MATVGSHVRHLGFFKNFILCIVATKFLEFSKKDHLFTPSNKNIIVNGGGGFKDFEIY